MTKKFIILCGRYRFFSSLSFYHGLDMFLATRDALVINGSYPGFFTSSHGNGNEEHPGFYARDCLYVLPASSFSQNQCYESIAIDKTYPWPQTNFIIMFQKFITGSIY